MWQLAHDAVFAGLKKAGKTIGYKNNTPITAIVCPAHLATPHPAVVDKTVWKCSKVPHKFGTVCKDTIPWMAPCNTHSEYYYACTCTRTSTCIYNVHATYSEY